MKKTLLALCALAVAAASCNKDDGDSRDWSSAVQYVSSVAEAQTILDQKASVAELAGSPITLVFSSALSGDQKLYIPATLSSQNTPAINIDANQGFEKLTLKNKAVQPDYHYAGKVDIVTSAQNNGDMVIDLDKAHVEIAGKYNDIDAKVSSTTLVIKAGTVVGNLTMNAGNVDVYGTVAKIIKGASLPADATITIHNDAVVGETEGYDEDNITHVGVQNILPDDEGWFTSRYDVSAWASVSSFEGKENVFKLTVDGRTALPNRPAGYQTAFRNTQGKGIFVNNPQKATNWEAEAKIFVSAEMMASSKPFRAELWMDVIDPESGDVNAYPILGVANVGENNEFTAGSTPTPKWRTYGYEDAAAQNGVWGTNEVAVTAGWHTVKITSNGQDIKYYIDNEYAGMVSRTEPATPIVAAARQLMLEVYNYNQCGVEGCPNLEDYSFDAYFADVKFTILQ